eukprot:CAMPEP_0194043114 /NCGR_PEP_ID=MMETSP0009_2-20130614/14799_1 /TAXON_ID=210454 /ORGANISM="Grammatophora oceanica, Strain CCMP 410" /LENGTH=730 /DNA_ID=CAMNT_0038687219 /DNA_START=34 /DNA_END=2226 /DNA_ORIENTATION=+
MSEQPPPALSPTELGAKVQRRGFGTKPAKPSSSSASGGAGHNLGPDVSASRAKTSKAGGKKDVMQQIAAGTTVSVGAASGVSSRISMSSSRSSNSGVGPPPRVGLTQDQVSAAMEMADNALLSVSDVVPSPRSVKASASNATGNRTEDSGSRKEMDLRNNDNAFHVIANLVLEKFQNGKTQLTKEDRQQLDSTLPPSVRESFVEAVRYRVKNCPPSSLKNIHLMTRQCAALGLAKEEDENPLLVSSPSKVSILNMPTVQQNSNGSTIQSLPHEDDTKEQHSVSHSGRFSSKIGLPPTHNADRVIPTSIPNGYKQTDESTVSVGSILTGGSMSEAHVSTTESLARQQLMAELREASNLMASSVTPEAAQFWRNHVVDLQARLRALHGETPVPEGTALSEENKALLSQYKNSFPSSDNHPTFSPASQTTDGYASRSTTAFQAATDATQPDYYEASRGFGGTEGRYEPPTQKSGGNVSPRSNNESQESGLPMVDVVAPADLPGGYHFEAEIEGRRFLATVPDGGVRKGQAFSCLMRDLETVGADVPLGRWRDRLCDCTKFGMTHPTLLNGLFCPLLLLGQVMTRVNYDFSGRPIFAKKRSNAYMTMWLIIMFWILMNIAIWFGFNYKWSKSIPLSIEDYLAATLVNLAGVVFSIYATMNTRAGLREKYMIREYRCYDVEDLCCAACCLPCTVCQMARHTASYDHVDATCCSDTGIAAKGNNNVVSESGEGSFV